MSVWDSWLLMALLTPAAWALACVIDVCFVGEGVYREPSDGAIITGLFGALPAAAGFYYGAGAGAGTPLLLLTAAFAGLCFFLHVYWYFKALFALNDVSSAETFNTLSVLLVPLLAFFVLGERLAPLQYLAVAVALLGVAVLVRGYLWRIDRHSIGFCCLSVVCVSLAMVMQAWVLQRTDYWYGVGLFSLAVFVIAVLAAVTNAERRRRVGALCGRFSGIFIVAELLQIAAVMASQRAVAIGPSVSLVAVIECALPLFVIGFSALALGAARLLRRGSRGLVDALTLQTASLPAKMTALLLIAAAVLLAPLAGASPRA